MVDAFGKDVVSPLNDEECWDFLKGSKLGRLAVSAAGRVDIFPVNYVVDDHKIYFRTAPGTKLASLTVNGSVALETDEVLNGVARSVVVHGTARELDNSREIEAADQLPLVPWIPSVKYNYVEVTAEELTGRRFEVGPEPDRY